MVAPDRLEKAFKTVETWRNIRKHRNIIIANEQPRKDARLRDGSLIEPCAIIAHASAVEGL